MGEGSVGLPVRGGEGEGFEQVEEEGLGLVFFVAFEFGGELSEAVKWVKWALAVVGRQRREWVLG